MHKHFHSSGQFKITNQPNMHVAGLLEEMDVQGGNSCMHKDIVQTPQRKALAII